MNPVVERENAVLISDITPIKNFPSLTNLVHQKPNPNDEILGKGGFSTVYLGKKLNTNEVVAVKVTDKRRIRSSARSLIENERFIMRKLRHPNVIKLY